ncbi:MAG: exo-alpha-sialidase [Promethearchaeota archaeon]
MLKIGNNLQVEQISKSILGKLHHAHCSSIVHIHDGGNAEVNDAGNSSGSGAGELVVVYYHAITEANREQRIYLSRKNLSLDNSALINDINAKEDDERVNDNDIIDKRLVLDPGRAGWSSSIALPDASRYRFDGNPVLWVAPDTGRLWLFYNVGFGWSFCWIKYRYSDDGGYNWSRPRLLYPFISRGVKNPPIMLRSGRYVLPAYVEFKYLRGVFFYSDNKGRSWRQSNKVDLRDDLIPAGYEDKKGRMVEQPTLVEREDGSLLALFRNDGRPMHKMLYSESFDGGASWSKAGEYILPNPAGGFFMRRLKSGNVGIIYNHSPAPDNDWKWRNPLSFAISDDDGRSWKWRRNLLEWHSDTGKGHEDPRYETFEYPTFTIDPSGEIHATWSHSHLLDLDGHHQRVTNIRYTHFSEAWVMEREYWPESFEHA